MYAKLRFALFCFATFSHFLNCQFFGSEQHLRPMFVSLSKVICSWRFSSLIWVFFSASIFCSQFTLKSLARIQGPALTQSFIFGSSDFLRFWNKYRRRERFLFWCLFENGRTWVWLKEFIREIFALIAFGRLSLFSSLISSDFGALSFTETGLLIALIEPSLLKNFNKSSLWFWLLGLILRRPSKRCASWKRTQSGQIFKIKSKSQKVKSKTESDS